MQKHPLYDIFKEKDVLKEEETFVPLREEMIVRNISPSAHFNKMGCVILAGGQGTRLGIKGPKGCVELPLKEKKTLFQYLFEKVKGKGNDLPLAIMTSPLNHQATVDYLSQHHYFGLTNVSVFSQEMVAVCDDDGNLCGQERSPDGNGKALHHLYSSGIWEKWREQGVEIVQVIPVDNPLAIPFDGELLAVHESEKVELVLRCVGRKTPTESLGIVGQTKGRLTVREYSELTHKMEDLTFSLGNTGIFSCTMDFAKKVSEIDLPWHLAHKQGEGTWVWKFETFIFDLFPNAETFKVLFSDRKKYFAPIKTLSGPNSLESVTKTLMT
ncbi:MAG: UTP--glucose-1-phosphate uridylyltransferase [Chlamydiia bacterium]|nr:UTP--glucose-1-phosphate uridylyltransferase [Chlamydiia bacterium]